MDDKIIELEKRSAHQEYMIEQLNEALIDYQKRINVLEQAVTNLKDQIASGALVKDIEDEEPPPHY